MLKCNSKICEKPDNGCKHKYEHFQDHTCNSVCMQDLYARCVEVNKKHPSPIDGTMYGSIYKGRSTPLEDIKTLLELSEITKEMQ